MDRLVSHYVQNSFCFVFFTFTKQEVRKGSTIRVISQKRRVSKQMEEYKVQNQNAGKPEDKKKMF